MLNQRRKSQSVFYTWAGARWLLLPMLFSGCAASSQRVNRADRVETATNSPKQAARRPLAEYRVLVGDVEGLGLLRKELFLARQVIATWASARGLHIAQLDRVEQFFERTRRGRHGQTGETCGRPLADWKAKFRYQRELSVDAELRANVTCEAKTGACTLNVNLTPGFDFDGGVLLDESAPYDIKRPYLESLQSSLARLIPEKAPDENNGLLGTIGIGTRGLNQVTAQKESFDYYASPALANENGKRDAYEHALDFSNNSARACFGVHGGSVDALIVVDKAGQVTQCESREADDEASLCVCAAVTKFAKTTAALRDTRAYLIIYLHPADIVTPWQGVVSSSTATHLDKYRSAQGEWRWRPLVSDPSIDAYEPPTNHALARCFADVKDRSLFTPRVIVGFDEKGKAASVDVRETGTPALSPAQRTCVEQAFLSSQAPCPAVQNANSQVELRIAVRPNGEDLDKPFD